MSSQALADSQVASELKKMTAFIRQEAFEKAREIHLKADEEFAIEKSKLVREGMFAIDSAYEKKFKQASLSQQITRSTVANKTRMKALNARQDLVAKLFDQARGRLFETGTNGTNYEEVLKGLILEGMYMLCEKKISLRCKEDDKVKVESAAKRACAEYKENIGRAVEALIDEKQWLPERSLGGVSMVCGGGKIELNNTFEERLRLCETDTLPSIRATLFGENQNRKFYN